MCPPRQCQTFTYRFGVMGGGTSCDLCPGSLPVPHNHFPLFSGALWFDRPAGPALVFLCIAFYKNLSVSAFLSPPKKTHTGVGVAEKWPNKASEKNPLEGNQSPKPLPVCTSKPLVANCFTTLFKRKTGARSTAECINNTYEHISRCFTATFIDHTTIKTCISAET